MIHAIVGDAVRIPLKQLSLRLRGAENGAAEIASVDSGLYVLGRRLAVGVRQVKQHSHVVSPGIKTMFSIDLFCRSV
jgi:hypothetical protein